MVVGDCVICAGLLLVVTGECFAERVAIDLLYILVAVAKVEVGAFWVGVGSMRDSVVVTSRAFTHHDADCPFQGRPLFSLFGKYLA